MEKILFRYLHQYMLMLSINTNLTQRHVRLEVGKIKGRVQ